jgi:N-acetyl-gamma-glutamyl-phosphate reductase
MGDIRVGVIGATGYTGSELVRLLLHHPRTSIELVTSQSHVGKRFSDVHRQFLGLLDDELEATDAVTDHQLDVVFLALPHGAAMEFVARYDTDRFRIIDLSGDFRLGSAAEYRKWYHKTHVAPERLADAVFGLPELFRHQLRSARLVANPGCYPTSAILALAPLLKRKLIEPDGIVVDSKSGVTGAGVKPKASTHFPNVFGNFSAYGLLKHRHTPEIERALGMLGDDAPCVLFTPHLLPIDRGILTTAYARPRSPRASSSDFADAYADFYRKEHFVRLLDGPPNVKAVRGSNFCDLYVTYDPRTHRVVALSAIDNLVKGAAGQAVQNMNVIFGQLEHTGLGHAPLSP